jgi:hypothetical protein
MVTLDTLRKLHEHGHQLAAYCPTCERWAVLDLPALIGSYQGIALNPWIVPLASLNSPTITP